MSPKRRSASWGQEASSSVPSVKPLEPPGVATSPRRTRASRSGERSVAAGRVIDRSNQDSQRGGPFLYTKQSPENGGPGQSDMGCNVGALGRTLPKAATAQPRRIRGPGANLAATTTYLRKLHGEEDSGWRKVAALLE